MSPEEILYYKNWRKGARNLKVAMSYRDVTQAELLRELKGLSATKLSEHLRQIRPLEQKDIERIMQYLEWPIGFLVKTLSEVKYSYCELYHEIN